ncbi:MAG: hypothetical protein ACLGHN_10515 [Bacteriovoracia bacterium]
MKYLIVSLLITVSAYGVEVGQYISHPDGSSFQSFNLEKSKVIYEKHSNFFDPKKDLSLGHFELSKKVDLSSEEKKLKEILNKIVEVDKFLRKKKSSFNELSSRNNHDSFILLEKFKVTKDSDLYPELKKIFDTLLNREWKQVDGVRLSEDLKKVIKVEEGKEVSREAFNMRFHCKKPDPPTVCGYKDLGILYIQ